MPPALIDEKGQPVPLGPEIGRGGEGVVYDLVGRPNLVAKLYLGQTSGDQAAKLAAMASATTAELSKLSAWPTGLVLDRGKAIGFLMPKISGFKPAFELYGPKLRLQKFPKADWRFLIRAATNAARVVAAIHAAGHVIGDINHGNMIVGQDATVRLIDCDSFQVSIGGRTWLCEVGVPTHQPPELQGISLNRVKRTPNHDAFGLAVLIFQMLCMARHPFSGKWLGSGEPPSIEDAIKTFCYAYSTNQTQTGMAPPPGSLPVNALSDPIKTLFEQAFSRAGVRPDGRPGTKKWIAALTNLEGALSQCSLVPSHYFLKTLPSCPWCRIERQTRTNLFPVTFIGSASGVDGFMALWQQVEAIPMPSRGTLLAIPKPLKPSRAARKAGLLRKATAASVAGYAVTVWLASTQTSAIPSNPELFALLVSPALLLAFLVLQVIGRRFFREFKDYNKKWQSLSSRFPSNAYASRAKEIKEQALKLKSDYDAALSAKKSAMSALHADRQNSQLIRYLDQFRVVGAGIPGIGAGKEAILQSYGIETAADIAERQIYQIPGFGHKTVQKLIAWRNHLAQSFRFNPNEPAAAADIAAIENAFAQKRRNLEKQLTNNLADIRDAVAAAVQYQDNIERERIALEPGYALAIANKKAASLLF